MQEIRASVFFIKLHTICLHRRNRVASSLTGFFSDHYSTIIDRIFQYGTREIFGKTSDMSNINLIYVKNPCETICVILHRFCRNNFQSRSDTKKIYFHTSDAIIKNVILKKLSIGVVCNFFLQTIHPIY